MKIKKDKFKNLRKKYRRFVYEKYSHEIKGGNLEISFIFKIEPDIIFRPKTIIKNIDKFRVRKIGECALNNLVFHIGLIEILSYWKTTCSPEIIIKAGPLDREQIKWWKNIIIKGMGQFFYENKIDFRRSNFLSIVSATGSLESKSLFLGPLKNRYLVPMGGGRDSIVTLEALKKRGESINCFLVNPAKTAKNVTNEAGIKNPVVVERKIDPRLLELNKMGYLNGHTPFTALLSFLGVFCAVLFDYKNIAFSNEKSANEGNVKYLGKVINHQYSKSSDFEKRFKYYCEKYLAKNINYFSFLRKYTELEISKIFIKYPEYFKLFSSCNAAPRVRGVKNKWCGACPKCLFVYLTLYPFLKNKDLLEIFGKDFFENKSLLPTMQALLGRGRAKPFECVGTYKESRLALSLSRKKAEKTGKIPYLLKN